jgi:hypothetical protein
MCRLAFIIALLLWQPARAQVDPREALMEAFFGEEVDALLMEELLDRIESYLLRPLDLNTAPLSELTALPFIDRPTARLIIAGRPLGSVDDLVERGIMDPHTMELLRPLITVRRHAPGPRPVRVDASTLTGRRIERSRGFQGAPDERTYPGPPHRTITRVRAEQRGSLSAGWVASRHPGEPFAWNPSGKHFGADHHSGHFHLQRRGFARQVLVGDFRAGFGHGLVLGAGQSITSTEDPVRPLLRTGSGLRPHHSASRDGYYRGLGMTLHPWQAVSLNVLASRRLIDATVEEPDDLFPEGWVSSLSGNRLHRTESERRRRGAVGETGMGAAARIETPNWHAGATWMKRRLDLPLRPGSQPYQMFDPEGTAAAVVGFHGGMATGPLHSSFEVARAGGALGLVAATGVRTPRAEAVIGVRRFDSDYHAPHAAVPAARSTSLRGERGIYLGAALRDPRGWSVSGLTDHFAYDWLRHAVGRPSSHADYRLAVRYSPRPWSNVTLEARHRSAEAGISTDSPGMPPLRALIETRRRSVRLDGRHRFSELITLGARLEHVGYRKGRSEPSRGGLLFFDTRLRPHPRLTLDGRVAIFDTQDFDSRIFAYERDVPYAFSVPALYGRGQRSYLLLQWMLTDQMDLSFRISESRLEDVREIGSGHDAIEGSVARDVRLLVRYRR